MFENAFPGLELEEDEEEEETIEEELIYLWEDNKPVYDLFRLLTSFLLENYVIDSMLLVELVKEEGLKFKQTLHYISYIHSGYVNILIAARQDNGNEDS